MFRKGVKIFQNQVKMQITTRLSSVMFRRPVYQLFMTPALIILTHFLVARHELASAQSIGYYPSLNLGFNPYLSPVFGYGLGLPYGAQGIGPLRDPILASSLVGPTFKFGHSSDLLGKIHAKTILKRLPFRPYSLYPQPGYLKSRLGSLKYPYAPLAIGGYGYGKHYGSAMIPNSPYKSAYGDYYTRSSPMLAIPSQSTTIHNHNQAVTTTSSHALQTYQPAISKTHSILKPLIKAGALLTTAALLGKKFVESPFKLDPAGMIINNYHP